VRLIAVDGGAGAGKTTFAGHLAAALGGAPVIPLDDFIAFDDLTGFWARLEEQVLLPLFQSRDIRYQQRDWVGDMGGRGLKEWRELPFSKTLIFEGVGASRRAVAERLAYAVWIDAPADTRLARGLERDAKVEGIRKIWERWMPDERRFLEADQARGRADLVVDGTVPYEGAENAFQVTEERPHRHVAIALQAYDALAESYAKQAEQKAENGFVEHPTMRRQLGDVQGLSVLDAGCGPGILASYLVERGASVTAFDVSPKMIELAKRRLGKRAQIHLADMAEPLTFLKDEEFNIIASSLAIDYVRDWAPVLREFWRVLKPGGRLVITVQHPLGAYFWYKLDRATGVQYVETTWRGFGGEPVQMPDYYRSFEEMVNPLINAGFELRQVRDALPIEALRAKNPDAYEKFSRVPIFLCLEALKRREAGGKR
jgi:SAM-dependent methyltransferase